MDNYSLSLCEEFTNCWAAAVGAVRLGCKVAGMNVVELGCRAQGLGPYTLNSKA